MGSKEEVVYIIPVLRGNNQALPGVTHYLKSWEQKKKKKNAGSKLQLLTIVMCLSINAAFC